MNRELRRLDEAQLEREAARLEVEIDKLADGCWPGAFKARDEAADQLAAVQLELERRRT
jgi:hypothetical protein